MRGSPESGHEYGLSGQLGGELGSGHPGLSSLQGTEPLLTGNRKLREGARRTYWGRAIFLIIFNSILFIWGGAIFLERKSEECGGWGEDRMRSPAGGPVGRLSRGPGGMPRACVG